MLNRFEEFLLPNFRGQCSLQGCDLSGFFLISGFFVTKISTILSIFSLILCVLAQFYTIFQDFYYLQDFSWKAYHTPV